MNSKRKPATLKEISKKVGFSVSAVSAILINNPNCFAGQKAREKVLNAAEELGYRPNILARSLRMQKSYTLALIVPNFRVHVTLANIEMIESLAWEEGYHLFIGYSQNDLKKEESLLENFANRRVDGLILIVGKESKERPQLARLIAEGFPIVAIGRLPNLNPDSVSVDYFKGGYLAASHLVSLGHKRIWMIAAHPNNPAVKERISGFKEGLKRHHLSLKEEMLFLSKEEEERVNPIEVYIEESFKIIRERLEKRHRPTAIFAGNDEIALGVVRAGLERGLKIPEELSVIGFDDSQAAVLSSVPLTTIYYPKETISKKAFEVLMKKINGDIEKPVHILLSPELIIRSSTGPAEKIT